MPLNLLKAHPLPAGWPIASPVIKPSGTTYAWISLRQLQTQT
jgi:hypothetical protein